MKSYKYPIKSYKYLIKSYKYPIKSYKYPIKSYKYPIKSYKYPIKSYKYTIKSYKYPIKSYKYPILIPFQVQQEPPTPPDLRTWPSARAAPAAASAKRPRATHAWPTIGPKRVGNFPLIFWIGLRENLNRKPMGFDHQIQGFPAN
jgi:hypothetical protein